MADDYRISNGVASVINGTGVVTVAAGITAIAGAGTAFLTELHVGDLLIISGNVIGSIASITDNDDADLTYVSAVSAGAVAFQVDPLVKITSINADAVYPLGDYYRWTGSKELANGLERAVGRARASWLWKNIGTNLRTALLTYCTSKSARVYIRTLVDPSLGTFGTYQAAMLWPDGDYTHTPDFMITFKDLVVK